MKIFKKINNNYALAYDSNNEVIIVEGKGIGFLKLPYELTDLKIITRTYYNTTEQHVSLIQSVSDEVLELSSQISCYAELIIGAKLNNNLAFTLADHIQFCLERIEKHIDIKMPIFYDIENLYPKESKVAEFAVKLIEKELHVSLPEGEKTGIAMNIINSELSVSNERKEKHALVQGCVEIIENCIDLKLDKKSFSYSRFISHLEYLFNRIECNEQIQSENIKLYSLVCEDYPQIKDCVNKIEELFKNKTIQLNREEKLYLMLHINRLCSREDCN